MQPNIKIWRRLKGEHEAHETKNGSCGLAARKFGAAWQRVLRLRLKNALFSSDQSSHAFVT